MDSGGGHIILEPVARLAGHERPVNALSFSFDGEVLVSGGWVCTCVCAHECVCVYVLVRVHVCAYMCMCVCVGVGGACVSLCFCEHAGVVVETE